MSKKEKLPEKVRTLTDDYANAIVAKNNGKRIIVSLKLSSETKHRRLGVVNLKQKTINIVRNRTKHLYRKLNSYGFNDTLLRQTTHFDTIRLRDEFESWKIPLNFILEHGKYLHHLQQGFEKQRFISLPELAQFKVENII